MPNVFRQIKSNDVHQRPFKAYKHYKISNATMGVGYVTHSATYYGGRIDHDGEIPYPLNSDGANKHVVWYSLQQNYYPDNARSVPEHVLNPLSVRHLLQPSASSLTIPYNDVGERIKNNTVFLSSSIGTLTVTLEEDGDGNLIDTAIDSTTFATASKNFFYMSFNDNFRAFKEYVPNQSLGLFEKTFEYKLNGSVRHANHSGSIEIVPGIDVSSSLRPSTPSGFGAQWGTTNGSYIRIPHEDVFNRFGHCDDWTISFWIKDNKASGTNNAVILSKGYTETKQQLNLKRSQLMPVTFEYDTGSTLMPAANVRTPFTFTLTGTATNKSIVFTASDGTNRKTILGTVTAPRGTWSHIVVRNSGSMLNMYLNANTSGTTSGSLPQGPTANEADIMIGSRTKTDDAAKEFSLAELRMYDYAVSDEGISSLANNNYESGSCYQTNVVGNVFHRNGQIVTSSPLPKHNTGSGTFGSERTWDVKWRGTHTIYENQVFVRVPKDTLNVTINPSSTYIPATDGGDVCTTNQTNLLPGEVRKDLFISGTLKPYVTTIGLYDDQSQLLAVGKLAQPIQKRDDIDMNFIVRWDY